MSVHSVEKIKPKKPDVRREEEQWFKDRGRDNERTNITFQGPNYDGKCPSGFS